MSESLLTCLMQLFAIAAKLQGANQRVRQIIENFLVHQLSLEDPEVYLEFFETFVLSHNRKSPARAEEGISPKLTVRDSTKMLLLCNQINEELTQQQKVNVLFTLFSLIKSDEVVEDQELEFLSSVAEIFNLTHEEYHLVEKFALKKSLPEADMDNLIIISAQAARKYRYSKHIEAENLPGYVAVLRYPSIGMYLVKYEGTEAINLNGTLMKENEVYTLQTGSSIKSSSGSPIYYSDIISRFLDDETSHKLVFEAKGIEYKFPSGKTGLHSLTFSEQSGKMVGLMGASGAGKSTLMEVLNGNLVPSKGEILINGRDLHKNRKKLEGVIGYVPQDDLLIEELTVFQNLYYAAKLCFGNFTDAEIEEKVNKTLSDIGLSDIAHLKVGNPMEKTISGGERKRVNIGLELLRAPTVLFLDEPTSGLSSRDSVNIMELLKDLALSGKLIFVVIHQPSSDIFKMFDKLMIMDTGGYPIYYGNPIEAIVYFKSRVNQIKKEHAYCYECGNVNLELIFDIVEAKEVNEFGVFTKKRKISPKQWYQKFNEHIVPQYIKPSLEPIKQNYKKSLPFRQFKIFSIRDFLSKINNRQYLLINLLQAPLLALILAYINRYYKLDMLTNEKYMFSANENMPVFLFISIIVALFLGLVVSAEEIFHDRKIRKRESFLHLNRYSYLFSKVLILFTLSALQTITFILISNYILEIKGMTTAYWAVLFSVSCFANVLGLNISSSFNSAVTIYIMIPILLIPQLVLGGIVLKFDKINPNIKGSHNVPWVCEIMASRWAYEALMVAQHKDNAFQKHLFPLEKAMGQAEYKKIYFLPVLESKVEYLRFNLKSVNLRARAQMRNDLKVLKNEFAAEATLHPDLVFKHMNDLVLDKFNDAIADSALLHIDKLEQRYILIFNKAYEMKNEKILAQTKTPEAAQFFLQQSHQYNNATVADYVKNANDETRLVELDQRLVQKIYPIYKDPDPNAFFLDFRTHFFSAIKRLGNWQIDTLVFNVIIIWVMTIVLFFTLYYDLLRRAIDSLTFARRNKFFKFK